MVWLDNSRILAIYAVVLLHVASAVERGSDIGTEYWWFGNIYESAVRWCVPVFVMVSGALLLDPNKKEDLLTFYKKRFSRILVPISIWTVFFLAAAFLKNSLMGNELTIMDLLKRVLSGRPYYHMWFLYMILGLYLFTPFFRKIIANSTKNELVFLAVITFAISAFNYAYGGGRSKLFINWFLLYAPFFFVGYLIRQDKNRPSIVVLWGAFLFSFLLTCVGYYLTDRSYFYGYLSISVIPMSISIMYIFKTLDKPIYNECVTKKLSLLTLGIYLIHPLILEIIRYKEYGAMSFHPLISIPIISFVVFVLSLGVAWIIYQVPYLRRII